MSQSEAIGSSSCKCNGPISGHQWHMLEKYWAKGKPWAAAAANAMGPSQHISSICQEPNGPKQGSQQQWLLMELPIPEHWQCLLKKKIGPSKSMGSSSY